MNIENVWVVEGGPGDKGESLGAFDLRVERGGLTLTDPEEPTDQRLWPWETIGGIEVTRGAGTTPDGRPATSLDVIVNGWPVHLVVPTDELSNAKIVALGVFAPVSQILREHRQPIGVAAARRWSAESGRWASSRARALPASLRSRRTAGIGVALTLTLIVVTTVVAVAISDGAGNAPEPVAAHNRPSPSTTDSAPAAAAGPSSSVPSATTSASSPAPAFAASSSGGGADSHPRVMFRPVSAKPVFVLPARVTSPATSPTTQPPTTGTTTATPTTSPLPTTTGPPRSTTTTTRPKRRPPPTTTTTSPPTTTTSPTTTTTGGRRKAH